MPLTQQQHNLLIQQCNTVPLNFLVQHVLAGNVRIDELTTLDSKRRNLIEERSAEYEWTQLSNKIQNIASQDFATLSAWRDELEKFISKCKNSAPYQQYLSAAQNLLTQVENTLQPIIAEKERADWEQINPFDRQSILDFYHKYPQTTHFEEIDEYFWNTLNLSNLDDLELYESTFSPNGKHLIEVKEIRKTNNEWSNLDSNDIFALKDFIDQHPHSPFIANAKTQLNLLKELEFEAMKNSPSSYEIERLRQLINQNIITVDELVGHGIFKSHNAFSDYSKRLAKSESMLPDINATIKNSIPEPIVGNGNTDIFLFGIPSTGKTCVLMGLSSTADLQVSLIGGGGEYAAALQLYTENGKTIGRTPGDFVTTINAKINDKKDVHNINIVEMSGEEFAYDIVYNPDKKFTFDDMASGTTDILKNENKKVFFIIIDPTADTVKVDREIRGINEYGEEVITGKQQLLVNQRIAINKLINIFGDESNAPIMKKVDAIHFIMTKADMLDGLNGNDRETNAVNIFNNDYKGYVLQPLIDICKDYNINYSTQHIPKLFNFSLGDFYIGGLYDYNPADSNRLVTAIKNVTQKQHKVNFVDKVRKLFN